MTKLNQWPVDLPGNRKVIATDMGDKGIALVFKSPSSKGDQTVTGSRISQTVSDESINTQINISEEAAKAVLQVLSLAILHRNDLPE